MTTTVRRRRDHDDDENKYDDDHGDGDHDKHYSMSSRYIKIYYCRESLSKRHSVLKTQFSAQYE